MEHSYTPEKHFNTFEIFINIYNFSKTQWHENKNEYSENEHNSLKVILIICISRKDLVKL